MNKDFMKMANQFGYAQRFKNMTPYITETSNLNLTTMDVFSKLMLDSRIIFLGTDIDDYVANIINAQLLYLTSDSSLKDKKGEDSDITMYINSGGGEIYSGNSILDVMDYVKNSGIIIKTVNIGLSASMSAVILSNGSKGHRYSLKRSRVMIHQPLGGTGYAQATDIEITAKEINLLKRELASTLSDNTGKDVDTILRDCERDFWMSSKEAIEYGIIDKVI
jgi:ATP-dependent Clp protease protease subunit